MQILTLRRLCRHLMHVALACLAVLAVALVVAVVVLPRTSKSNSLSVLTGSMSPSIPAGSLIFIKPVDPRQIAVGDVITFHPRANAEVLVTHRVVGAVFGTNPKLSFRTKGDANNGDDPNLVPADAVVGKVVYDLPHLGSLSARARTPGGLVSLIGIALALLFGKRLWSSGRQAVLRRRGARDISLASSKSVFPSEPPVALVILPPDGSDMGPDDRLLLSAELLDDDVVSSISGGASRG